jgi:hypothetical protein
MTHLVFNVSLQEFSTASGAGGGYTTLNFKLWCSASVDLENQQLRICNKNAFEWMNIHTNFVQLAGAAWSLQQKKKKPFGLMFHS